MGKAKKAQEPARLLRLPDVMARVGLARSTIYLMIQDKEFPAPINIGSRAVAWVESDIQAWIDDKIRAAKEG